MADDEHAKEVEAVRCDEHGKGSRERALAVLEGSPAISQAKSVAEAQLAQRLAEHLRLQEEHDSKIIDALVDLGAANQEERRRHLDAVVRMHQLQRRIMLGLVITAALVTAGLLIAAMVWRSGFSKSVRDPIPPSIQSGSKDIWGMSEVQLLRLAAESNDPVIRQEAIIRLKQQTGEGRSSTP